MSNPNYDKWMQIRMRLKWIADEYNRLDDAKGATQNMEEHKRIRSRQKKLSAEEKQLEPLGSAGRNVGESWNCSNETKRTKDWIGESQ